MGVDHIQAEEPSSEIDKGVASVYEYVVKLVKCSEEYEREGCNGAIKSSYRT